MEKRKPLVFENLFPEHFKISIVTGMINSNKSFIENFQIVGNQDIEKSSILLLAIEPW